MNSDNTLNELWSRQNTAKLPEINRMLSEIASIKKNRRLRLILQNLSLLITVVFMALVGYYAQSIMLATKLGILCMAIASFAFMAANNRIMLLLKKADPNISNKEYLKQLVRIKVKQFLWQKILTRAYFILLGLGICLTMMDYTSTSPHAAMIWALAFAWIVYTYFFLRPKKIQKQQADFDQVMATLGKIEEQIV